jgi:hypothetical protein
MATVVFINRLQPADGKRDALIGLLREFADSINADPECQQRPVCRGKPHSPLPELTFQHRDLMPQGKDLHVLVPIAHPKVIATR